MNKIKKIVAREILDSRGNPTVEAEVFLESGIKAWSQVPSGASTGEFEALELRDGDENRFGGKGVLKAIENVNTIINDALVGIDPAAQRMIDEKMIELDGTENKSNFGANAILSVSLAVCRVVAVSQKIPLYQHIANLQENKKVSLPIPMFNIINGGMHADSGLAIQEYKLIPNGIETFKEQYRAGAEIFHALKKNLAKRDLVTAVGDEGGFAPRLENNTVPFILIKEAAESEGYKMGEQINIGIDAAANSFYDDASEEYFFELENKKLSAKNLLNVYESWKKTGYFISLEDGLTEYDWHGWTEMNERFGDDMMIIGDDLLVTNVERLQRAIDENACNSVLIKPNQIGTLTETLDCIKLAKENNFKTIVSHRSGETIDDFIADLAVGAGTEFIKTGSLSRGERICKYNRLLRIEEKLFKMQ
ncbi:MAG: phosphopyruvate hydratase [Candidatus Moranbacteria bacterium]|nr:phosphopyruvate hydratase [Candidatus Moranbacteria bacterium]